MRTSLRRWLSGIAVACFVAAPVFAQSASPETKTAGATCTVKGRVTSNDGKGLAGIAVVLMPAEQTPYYKPAGRATTDDEGNYTMTNVAAGRYHLQAIAPAHTSNGGEVGNLIIIGRNRGRVLVLLPGETVENQNMTLVRGGVITGRVTDSDGRPLVEQQVMLAEVERKTIVSGFQFLTDDRGVYRIYGLPAGRYRVSVGEDKNSGMVRAGAGGIRYTRTFHPNATEESQAKIIEVTPGSEATGVDIALGAAAKTYEATGHVIDAETGKPVAGALYGYGALGTGGTNVGGWGAGNTKTEADGTFRLKNLTPGHYAAFVFPSGDFTKQSENYSDAPTFEITDADVSGLVIKMRRGASLSGVGLIEGTTDPRVLARISELSLSVHVMPPDPKANEVRAPSFGQIKFKSDGSFRITGLQPGKLMIRLGDWPPPNGFALTRIEHNGVEVRAPLEVGAGEQLTGLRIRISYGAHVVRGQIEVRNGGSPASLPEGARLLVWMRRVGSQNTQFVGTPSGEVDERGRFLIEGLAAGDYELHVNGRVVRGASIPPISLPPHRQRITIPESGETSLTVIYEISPKERETTP